jgi:hypothetical protein
VAFGPPRKSTRGDSKATPKGSRGGARPPPTPRVARRPPHSPIFLFLFHFLVFFLPTLISAVERKCTSKFTRQFMISSPQNSNSIQNNIQEADEFYSLWIRVFIQKPGSNVVQRHHKSFRKNTTERSGQVSITGGQQIGPVLSIQYTSFTLQSLQRASRLNSVEQRTNS